MIEKRYQVFVSSTYVDLQEERQEVIQALLELKCIPAGMELFQAANVDQWTLIKEVIDDCDYYVVIIGDRYGTIGREGISYTDMEYRYALEQGKPIIGFLHENPGALPRDKTETDPGAREKLDAFRELVGGKVVKYWQSPADLGSKVSRSLVNLKERTPAIGWVKGDQVPDKSAIDELLHLRRRLEELESQLTDAPEGTEDLAQGDDLFDLNYSANFHDGKDVRPFSGKLAITWNEIVRALAPHMIHKCTENHLSHALDIFLRETKSEAVREDILNAPEYLPQTEGSVRVISIGPSTTDFQTIKIQLRALGLIQESGEESWVLTPYGSRIINTSLALKRPDQGLTESSVSQA